METVTNQELKELSYSILDKVSYLTTYNTKITYNLKLNQYEIWIEICPISQYKTRFLMIEIHKGNYGMFKNMWEEVKYRIKKNIKTATNQLEQEWLEEFNEELEEKRKDNGKI